MGRSSKFNGILVALRELPRFASLLTGRCAEKALPKSEQRKVCHQDQYKKQSHRKRPEKYRSA